MKRFWVLGGAWVLVSGAAAAQVASPDNDVVAPAPPAAAAPAAPPANARPKAERSTLRLAALGELGVATPVGCLGIVGDVVPFTYLALEVGVGTNGLGPQFSGMTRLRLPLGRTDRLVGFGVGYSLGKHEQTPATRDGVGSIIVGPLSSMDHNPRYGHTWHTAQWLNLELAVETVDYSFYQARVFGGLAMLLNPGDAVAAPHFSGAPELELNTQLVYFGIGIGYAG